MGGNTVVVFKGYILKNSSDLPLCSVEKNEMSSPSPPSLLLTLQAEVLRRILSVSLRTPGISHHSFCILLLLGAEGRSLLLISIWRLQTQARGEGEEYMKAGGEMGSYIPVGSRCWSQSHLPTTWSQSSPSSLLEGGPAATWCGDRDWVEWEDQVWNSPPPLTSSVTPYKILSEPPFPHPIFEKGE